MKTLIASMIVFIGLIIFGVFAYYYLDYTSNTLLTQTEKIEKSIGVRNWQQTKASYGSLNSSWNKTSTIWTVLVDHQELDNINVSMAKLKQYINTRYLPGITTELAELKLLIQHIPNKEAVNLKNVL